MPTVATPSGVVRYCVLIPTCGRWVRRLPSGREARAVLNTPQMAFLDDPDTLICVHNEERNKYSWLGGRRTREWQWIGVPNPTGSVAVVREHLRSVATKMGPFDYYVVTDDNAAYTQDALTNLVLAAHEYTVVTKRPCTMAGLHNTAPHFDKRLIATTSATLPSGLKTYANVAMIFQCYPHALYSRYRYPPDAYGLDDRHFYLWCIAQGVRDFRVCLQSPFNKARYQEGGQGDIRMRARKNGLAIARLATDFPDLVGAAGTLRIPWQLILRLKAGGTATRLAGGAMRKETDLVTDGTLTLKARRRT